MAVYVSFNVKRAIFTCIQSRNYRPPSLPLILDSDWRTILVNRAVSQMAALPRDVMSTKGKDVLDYALFLLLVDDLDEKPVDFLSIMKASVSATDVLKAIMLKIDERLLDNEVESVDSGFYTVVGHIWITCGKDMERTCEWLRLIFGPLLEAASAAYMADLKRSKRDRNGKETIRYQPQDSDLTFLRNLHEIQTSDSSDSEYSGTSLLANSSPMPAAAIPDFDSRSLSPLNPAVLMHGTINEVDNSLACFSVWADLPSPSGIDEELAERLGDDIPHQGEVLFESTMAPFSSEDTPTSSSALLPPLEINAAEPDRISDEQFETLLRELTLADEDPLFSEDGVESPIARNETKRRPETPLNSGAEPRRPLTPRN